MWRLLSFSGFTSYRLSQVAGLIAQVALSLILATQSRQFLLPVMFVGLGLGGCTKTPISPRLARILSAAAYNVVLRLFRDLIFQPGFPLGGPCPMLCLPG